MNRLLLLLGAAGLLLAAGCRKDDLIECAPTTPKLSLAEFTQRNGAPVQTFTLALGPTTASQVFTTTGGASFSFPAASFLLPTGIAATGTAQVLVREIYSVPDMVLSDMPTQLAGSRKLLISGGEFSIQVWQNGTRLRLAAGGARVVVQSPVPSGASSELQALWQQPATRLVGDSAGWVPAPPPTSTPMVNDTISATNPTISYRTPIPLDSVSWWNIDQLWQLYRTAPLGTVTVQTPIIPATSTGSTYVFIRPVGSNALARLYATPAAPTSWSGPLPTGANMVAIVLQSVNGQLYYGTQTVTTQNNAVITPTLAAVSEAEAIKLIRQL